MSFVFRRFSEKQPPVPTPRTAPGGAEGEEQTE